MTVQDGGRRGWAHIGVPRGGPVDTLSWQIGNALVDSRNAAQLEFAPGRVSLWFKQAALIALTGADCRATVAGQTVPMWRPLWLPADATLRIDPAGLGAWTYLCVAGGLQGESLLGSRGASLQAGLGRRFSPGDELTLVTDSFQALQSQRLGFGAMTRDWLDLHARQPIRILEGEGAGLLSLDQRRQLLGCDWIVGPNADRMASPLCGSALALSLAEQPSEPVFPGTVQLPPSGLPIVLKADAQTVGGYPRMAHVISADQPVLAQRGPGAVVRFQSVAAIAARRALDARHRALQQLMSALAAQWSELRR